MHKVMNNVQHNFIAGSTIIMPEGPLQTTCSCACTVLPTCTELKNGLHFEVQNSDDEDANSNKKADLLVRLATARNYNVTEDRMSSGKK
jgi:hypothetical protein